MTTPAIIAAHILTTTEPRMRAAGIMLAGRLNQPEPRTLSSRVIGAARFVESIDIVAITVNLGYQRGMAEHGRPKGDKGGKASTIPRPTESAAVEADRIRMAGFNLREALDRLYPDPAWPGTRVATAIEAAERVAGECWGALSPEIAWDNLHTAADVLADAAREAWLAAERARKIKAWGKHDDEPEAPDLTVCAGRMKEAPCGNHVSPHHHPETGSVHHADLCDDCYRLVCPVCWEKPRRTPGAQRCQRCEQRAWRAA